MGNLFLPVVSKVLPYVNGLVIAVQRLFSWVGNLLGIDLSKITTSVGSSEFDFGDLIEDTDDLTGSLDDAADAAKKLKHGLQSFDSLNVITTSDSSSSSADITSGLTSGLLDSAFDNAFSEYQAAWDEAFANMENRANEFADKVEGYLQPVKEFFENLINGNWEEAGKILSDIICKIFDTLSEKIESINWKDIGQKIGEFLAGIEWIDVITSALKLKFNIWEAIAEVWFGAFDAAPIETSIITAIGLLKFTKLKDIVAPKIAKAVMSTKLVSEMTTAWASLGGLKGILTTDLATIAEAGTLTEVGMTIGVGIIGGIAAAFVGFEVGKEIGKWIFPEDSEYYDNFSWFGESGFFETITKDAETSWNALNEMASDQNNIFISTLTSTIFPINGIIGKIDDLKTKTKDLKEKFDGIGASISNWADETNQDFEKWSDNVGITFNTWVSDRAHDLGDFYTNGIDSTVAFVTDSLSKFEKFKTDVNNTLLTWKNNSLITIQTFKTNAVSKFADWYSAVSSWFTLGRWEELGRNIIDGLKNGIENKLSSLSDSVSNVSNLVKNGIKNALDIHSPSRVMFALGEFTMEGFQLGMENLYSNIENSLGNFGSDLQYEIAPTPQPVFTEYYSSPVFPAAEYSNYSYYNSQNNYDIAETNMLLRELLSAVKEGKVIQYNGKVIGKTVRDEDMNFYNRTGRGMFQH